MIRPRKIAAEAITIPYMEFIFAFDAKCVLKYVISRRKKRAGRQVAMGQIAHFWKFQSFEVSKEGYCFNTQLHLAILYELHLTVERAAIFTSFIG